MPELNFMPLENYSITALELLSAYQQFWNEAVASYPAGTPPVKPSPRIPFHWPPAAVSHEYHVQNSEWKLSEAVLVDGQEHQVEFAANQHGVFARLSGFYNEALADSKEKATKKVLDGVKPLLKRQREIASLLGESGRFTGRISECSPVGLIRLLYATDRDISHDACVEIEAHASAAIFAPALIAILQDNRHPNRRSAQWCVLDLFEDLPSFLPSVEAQLPAIQAIRDLMWDAEDDYARTIYKAGVVLGGHVCTEDAAAVLLECLHAPSKFGRRASIHALFHLREWMPEQENLVIQSLLTVAETDLEPLLREYASAIAKDIMSGGVDHVGDVLFTSEA